MQTDASVSKQGWAVAALSALGAAIALALPVLGEALNPLGQGLAMLVSAFCLKLAAEVRQPPTTGDQPADDDAGNSSSSSTTEPAAELAKLAAR